MFPFFFFFTFSFFSPHSHRDTLDVDARRRSGRRTGERARRGRTAGAIDATDEWHGRNTPSRGGAGHARTADGRAPSAWLGTRRPPARRRSVAAVATSPVGPLLSSVFVLCARMRSRSLSIVSPSCVQIIKYNIVIIDNTVRPSPTNAVRTRRPR